MKYISNSIIALIVFSYFSVQYAQMKFFEQPISSEKLPLLLMGTEINQSCVSSETTDWKETTSALKVNLLSKYNSNTDVGLKSLITNFLINLNVSREVAEQINYEFVATDLFYSRINTTDVIFKPGPDCFAYYNVNSDKFLITKLYRAGSSSLHISHTLNSQTYAGLFGKILDFFNVNAGNVNLSNENKDINFSGKDLIVGYESRKFTSNRIDESSIGLTLKEIKNYEAGSLSSIKAIKMSNNDFRVTFYTADGDFRDVFLNDTNDTQYFYFGNSKSYTVILGEVREEKIYISIKGIEILFD